MSTREITLIESAEAQTGARLTFEQAFAAHHGLVYRYAHSLTRDAALAEDVAQEVFLRLHRQLDTAQKAGMLRPWLLRVTVNVARNLLRTRRRASRRDEAFGTELLLTARTVAPDDDLSRKTEIENARRALDQLKDPLRGCLLLRHEGLSYREIAVTLGLRESSVGSLIARARRKFMEVYSKLDGTNA